MIKNSTRYNRLVDDCPVPDVEGGDGIRFTLKTTGNTSEFRTFRPVSLIDGMTDGAFPACVFWIDNDNRDARFLGLVFNKRPELVESPRRMDIAVLLSNLCEREFPFLKIGDESEPFCMVYRYIFCLPADRMEEGRTTYSR